jgi:hypothetical protein
MTVRLLRTAVRILAAMLVPALGHPLYSQSHVDRMEALVQADRSASAASWKLGLRAATPLLEDHMGPARAGDLR